MAEDRDDAEKTEEPTQRRLDQAREKGRTVLSREVTSFLLLLTGTILTLTSLSAVTAQANLGLEALLARAAEVRFGPVPDHDRLFALLWSALWPWLPVLAAFCAAAIGGPLVQGAAVWSADPLMPKAERISPLAGAKRLFSVDSLVELAKSIAKVAFVGTAAGLVIWRFALVPVTLAYATPGQIAVEIGRILLAVLAAATAASAAIAVLDWLHQRFRFMRQMRMSRRDLLEELKDTDGNPHTKQRHRSLRMERMRHRMIADVPKSTVVITNPTHVAVALRYEQGMAAPTVMAKGYDQVAQTIKAIAREHTVPIVENPPLARALASSTEPGDAVPVEHYQAVAEVIAYVMRAGQRRLAPP